MVSRLCYGWIMSIEATFSWKRVFGSIESYYSCYRYSNRQRIRRIMSRKYEIVKEFPSQIEIWQILFIFLIGARQHIKEELSQIPPADFSTLFPSLSSDGKSKFLLPLKSRTSRLTFNLGIDFLKKLLLFDHRIRPSAEQALGHPFLAKYREAATEPTTQPIQDIHKDAKYPIEQWRSKFEFLWSTTEVFLSLSSSVNLAIDRKFWRTWMGSRNCSISTVKFFESIIVYLDFVSINQCVIFGQEFSVLLLFFLRTFLISISSFFFTVSCVFDHLIYEMFSFMRVLFCNSFKWNQNV